MKNGGGWNTFSAKRNHKVASSEYSFRVFVVELVHIETIGANVLLM